MDWLISLFDPATIGGIVSQFQSEMHQPGFWLAVTEIIWINILLSGDNALVIAMACRGLAPKQRLWGMVLGALAAVLLRIVFTFIVASLMSLPYLKLVGGLALIVIAAKLLVPEAEDDESVASVGHLWAAIQIVVVADIIMSLDNVIAVAAAAHGSVPLLILGLAVSVPLIVAGAALIMAALEKLPILIWAGAALLGWIAGDVIASDPVVAPRLEHIFAGGVGRSLDGILTGMGVAPQFRAGGHGPEWVLGALGVIVVLAVGTLWRRKRLREIEGAHGGKTVRAATADPAASPIKPN